MSANNRASLLAGLRTGGVRQPAQMMPQTAAPNVSSFGHLDMPMTAAVNGSFNANQHASQAQRAQAQQQQALQMQLVQMEILRLQALQQAQHQYQIELIRQQQHQQQQQPSTAARQPMSAAPNVASFTNRRVSQAEQLKSQLHLNNRAVQDDFQAPMTASLGGKFGGRLNPNATSFRMGGFLEEEETQGNYKISMNTAPAGTANGNTAVISGGTALGFNGNGHANAAPAAVNTSPSKGDSAANWRRAPANGNRSASVSVTVTPPPSERNSPAFGQLKGVHRPEPLRFQTGAGPMGPPLVIVDSSEGDFVDDDGASSSSSAKSEPTTPPSNDTVPPLMTREEATKRLYEGLGMGRAVPQTAAVEGFGHRATKDYHGAAAAAAFTSVGSTFPRMHTTTATTANRVSSQPMRQPLGPPSGVDELSSKNFATRIRRKAIGGLGAMLDARANRREVEAL